MCRPSPGLFCSTGSPADQESNPYPRSSMSQADSRSAGLTGMHVIESMGLAILPLISYRQEVPEWTLRPMIAGIKQAQPGTTVLIDWWNE